MAKENVTECDTVLKRTGLLDFVNKSIALQTTVHKIKQKLVISRICTIRDCVHKCLALQQSLGRASLVAIFLQDANSQREEKITMSFYSTLNLDGRNKQLVTLRLVKRNLYLSCSLGEGGPQLCLETNNNVGELNNCELQRFIFMKSENGSTSSFESAACPGWYISTSQKENDLVQMMPESDQRFFKNFLVFP
uniref:Interleukin-1 n=1 Tax=Leptobrachium leishanense TaxID=445787 RepID=A0A8C5M343_9ANUR